MLEDGFSTAPWRRHRQSAARAVVLLAGWLTVAGASAQEPPPVSLDEQAEQACARFDLEECVRLNESLLGAPDIDSQRRASAYLRLASAYAAMEDVARSSQYWRLLLRLRPEMELPEETSPKILMVFRSVQLEEQRLRDAVAEERRRQMIERIRLELALPERHQGGLPLTLVGRLADPDGGVRTAWLRHRMHGQQEFAALPLQRGNGELKIELPGALTAGTGDRAMEVFVELHDADGNVLTTVPSAPVRVVLLPGDVPRTPIWKEPVFIRSVVIGVGVGVPLVVGILVVTALAMIGGAAATLWLTSIQPGLGRNYQVVP